MSPEKSLTYKQAGVDIDAGNALVQRIKPLVRDTHRPGVAAEIGGFGGLFELDSAKYRRPLLVAGADGVGTKLKLAIELERYDTVGIDLVAMCANDVLVQGAEPLFFLDYYATGRLDIDVAEAVIRGISAGCRQAGAALLGGETAEMPGMYRASDFDLAGFCVGVVDRDRLIDGSACKAGDILLGLASSGPHANGYSLIRRVVARLETGAATPWQGRPVGEALLAPTRIYVKPVLALISTCPVAGIAHVTGGGLAENLARILPSDVDAMIAAQSWTRPPIFDWLQAEGQIDEAEMLRTFNCGIGMVLVVPAAHGQAARRLLEDAGEQVIEMGAMVDGSGQVFLGG
jgi:phosphoribosylformylglycinamidine cyclo-ligase